jgi:Ca2+/Na+ antiporter
MYDFLTGVIAISCFVASLFFSRFWRQSRERLFIYFAVSFLLLGINRLTLIYVPESLEPYTWLYLVRLLAFVVLLVGILEANRQGKK